jgi:hypothetical protein
MVICDFNFAGFSLPPYEADAVLIIDPDAVLSLALTVQRLQPVSGRHLQIIERHGGMQQEKLPECPHSQIGGNPSTSPRLPKLLRIRIPETRYHVVILPRYSSSVKHYYFKALTGPAVCGGKTLEGEMSEVNGNGWDVPDPLLRLT